MSEKVERFEDLIAYSALFRPGCMKCLQKDSFVMLENGKKEIKNLQPGLDNIAYLNLQ